MIAMVPNRYDNEIAASPCISIGLAVTMKTKTVVKTRLRRKSSEPLRDESSELRRILCRRNPIDVLKSSRPGCSQIV